MAGGAAHIRSPEVLRRFRGSVVRFATTCESAVLDVRQDLSKMMEWLQGDQLRHWKSQLRKREELFKKTRLDYIRIREDRKRLSRASTVDARKLMDKAKRQKEEAEHKIAMLKKWTNALHHEAERQMAPLSHLSIHLDHWKPRALNRLDKMIEELDRYFGKSGASGGVNVGNEGQESVVSDPPSEEDDS